MTRALEPKPETAKTPSSPAPASGAPSGGAAGGPPPGVALGALAGFGQRSATGFREASAASALQLKAGSGGAARRAGAIGLGQVNLQAPGLAPAAGDETEKETPEPLPASAEPDAAAAEAGAPGPAQTESEGGASPTGAATAEAGPAGTTPSASGESAGEGSVGGIGVGRVGGAGSGPEEAVGVGQTEDIGPATTPGTLIMTSTTELRAPSGAGNHRTTIGVGERVNFLVNHAATFAATTGTPTEASASSNSFAWQAPAEAGTATITATSGPRTASITFNIVAPDNVSMTRVNSWSIEGGVAGAVMECTMLFSPLNVSFGYANIKEISGPGANVSGFFNQYSASQLYHNASADWTELKRNNMPPPGKGDTAGLPNLGTGPFSAGTLDYVIPYHYRLDGESGNGRPFRTITQAMSMAADGTVTIRKAGASVSRAP